MTAKPTASASASSFALSSRLHGLDQPTVWHEFSPLSNQYGSINLGQGFPDWDPPAFVQDALIQAVKSGNGNAHADNINMNQYARSAAHLPLARVLAEQYSARLFSSSSHNNNHHHLHQESPPPPRRRRICAETEVATAVGCTQALYCALQGLLNPDDEVILLEPFFDIYRAQVLMAGGVPVYVPLRERETHRSTGTGSSGHYESSHSSPSSPLPLPDASSFFTLDLAELEAAITDRTKVIILNTPHNPSGKVFSRSELQGIADLVRKYPRLVLIADEVYEYLIYDPIHHPHVSIAQMLWDQTLTLSSAGKTFSATGWKVGWAIGPAHLVKAVSSVQQWVTFSAPTPNQEAVARALRIASSQPYQNYPTYYHWLVEEYRRKRQLLMDCVSAAGLRAIVPSGGFFILADTSHWDSSASSSSTSSSSSSSYPPNHYLLETTEASPKPMTRDWALCRFLTKEVGVTAIPPSAFYSPAHQHLARNYIRLAFCKKDDTIRAAHERLESFFFGHPKAITHNTTTIIAESTTQASQQRESE